MSGDLGAGVRQPLVELNKQFADPGQREDAVREMDVRDNPFDRQDFIVLVISIAIIVFLSWLVAPW